MPTIKLTAILRVLSITPLLIATGCATTGNAYNTQRDDWEPMTNYSRQTLTADSKSVNMDGIKSHTENLEDVFQHGATAYRAGNLDSAEQYFRQVLQKNPRHSRATYNLSMVYLQRAYEGLQHFTRLESSDDQRRVAHNLIQQLDGLSN